MALYIKIHHRRVTNSHLRPFNFMFWVKDKGHRTYEGSFTQIFSQVECKAVVLLLNPKETVSTIRTDYKIFFCNKTQSSVCKLSQTHKSIILTLITNTDTLCFFQHAEIVKLTLAGIITSVTSNAITGAIWVTYCWQNSRLLSQQTTSKCWI